jgi:hypothetical protein
MERLAQSLNAMFELDRGYDLIGEDGKKSRMLDPEILFGRVAALNDTAQEWKFLRKFQGALRVVKD